MTTDTRRKPLSGWETSPFARRTERAARMICGAAFPGIFLGSAFALRVVRHPRRIADHHRARSDLRRGPGRQLARTARAARNSHPAGAAAFSVQPGSGAAGGAGDLRNSGRRLFHGAAGAVGRSPRRVRRIVRPDGIPAARTCVRRPDASDCAVSHPLRLDDPLGRSALGSARMHDRAAAGIDHPVRRRNAEPPAGGFRRRTAGGGGGAPGHPHGEFGFCARPLPLRPAVPAPRSLVQHAVRRRRRKHLAAGGTVPRPRLEQVQAAQRASGPGGRRPRRKVQPDLHRHLSVRRRSRTTRFRGETLGAAGAEKRHSRAPVREPAAAPRRSAVGRPAGNARTTGRRVARSGLHRPGPARRTAARAARTVRRRKPHPSRHFCGALLHTVPAGPARAGKRSGVRQTGFARMVL